jgi:hypothetical protein
MAEEFIATLSPSEINVTLTLDRTVNEGGGGGVSSWNDLEDKPATFPPSTHNHDDLYYTESEIDSKLAARKMFPVSIAVNKYLLTTRHIGYGYGAGNLSSTALNSTGKMRTTPFIISDTISVDALAIYVVGANAGASAVVRLGIYADDGDGRPGTLIVDAGTASINATGLKTLTFTQVQLTPGIYHAALSFQNLDTAGSNPTFAGASTTTATAGESAPQASNNMLPYELFTMTGALTNNPAVASITRSDAGVTPPHIWVRRSA